MEIQAQQALRASESLRPALGSTETPKESFSDVIKGFLKEVDGLQVEAGQAQEKLLTGEVQDLHQVVVAVAKADLAFRYMLEIRNRLTDAYQEIMRTRV
ncbi:MAG: flagellar hook-basal body complex protein FliE [Planctomycetota bacterium]